MVKEFRIECPNRQVFRPRQTVESRASSDWLAFRVPLVTLVTCRRQVCSIYRTSEQQMEVILSILESIPSYYLSY